MNIETCLWKSECHKSDRCEKKNFKNWKFYKEGMGLQALPPSQNFYFQCFDEYKSQVF